MEEPEETFPKKREGLKTHLMKRMIISFCLTSFYLVSTFPFNSCNRKITRETCSMRKANTVMGITYKSMQREVNFEGTSIWIFDKPVTQENGESHVASLNSDFYLETTDGRATKPFMIILYLDKRITSDGIFEFKNIQAISNFSSVRNLVQHNFYKKMNGEFAKVEELSVKTPVITDNVIQLIRNNIVFTGSNGENTTVLTITIGNPKLKQSPNKVDVLYRAVKIHCSLQSQ